VPGAKSMIKSRWRTTAFLGGANVTDAERVDPRIINHKFPRRLRRTGADEMPQLREVASGQMQLVGVRAWDEDELEGLRVLYQARNRLKSNDLSKVLTMYPKIIRIAEPKCAIISPLSAAKAKDESFLSRMVGELIWLNKASPWVDLNLMLNTLVRRTQGIGAR